MSLRKLHVFYGWFIVFALFFIWASVGGITVVGFTSYIEPLSTKFGWNYTQVTLALSLFIAIQMIISPVVGLLIDRYSVKKLIFAGILFTSIGIVLLSRIASLGQFYLCYIFIGITSCTCTVIVPMTVVGKWFREKTSLATGILMAGSGIGGFLVPLITGGIDRFGWQTAMTIVGVSLLVIISPLSLLIRQKPEDHDYLSEDTMNENPVLNKNQSLIQDSGENIGMRQALKRRPFWHISIAFICHSLAGYAVITHIMPYLSTLGVERTTSSFLAGALAIIGGLGRIILGWFGDRFDKRWVAASGTILTGLSLLFLSYITTMNAWVFLPAVILFGIGYSGTYTLHSILLKEYFGIRNLGAILGFSYAIATIGNMVSPPLVSWLFESSGSYRIAWFVLACIAIIGVVVQVTNPAMDTLKQRAGSNITGI